MSEERDKPVMAYVVTHPEQGERVGLWERHPDHPGGEVFVFGQDSDPVEVALTPAVREALAPSGDRGEGPPRLVRLEGDVLSQRQSVAKARRELTAQQGAALLLRTGGTPADVEDDEKRAEATVKLEERIRELEGKLNEQRTELRAQVEEEVRKELHDPERREQRADEIEKQNAAVRNPVQLERPQADEPRQRRTDEPIRDPVTGESTTGGVGPAGVGRGAAPRSTRGRG